MISADFETCTGCLACQSICPGKAVGTVRSADGFTYPVVHVERCSGCSLCNKVCICEGAPSTPAPADAQRYFAFIHKDGDVLRRSSSGGAFTALSDRMLARGGVVYGAAYDRQFRVVHAAATDAAGRDAFCGSKYIQSDMTGMYEAIEKDLAAQKEVLFTGTPCQCAALRNYLDAKGSPTEGLYMVDIFCHGVLSPGLWNGYLQALAAYAGAGVSFVTMRDKARGWRTKSMKVATPKRDISRYCNTKLSILRLYESNNAFRASCYRCPFHTLDRTGDLSIGDFWGVKRHLPHLDDNSGVSSVIANTGKGRFLLEDAAETGWLEAVRHEQIMQQALCRKTTPGGQRAAFLDACADRDTHVAATPFMKYSAKAVIKRDFLVPILHNTALLHAASNIKRCLKSWDIR